MIKIVEMEFGSTVYGTRLPTSDSDFKGIYLPTTKEIVLQKAGKVRSQSTKINMDSKSTARDVEWEWFSLQEYIKLLLEGQTVALTMLFMPDNHITYTQTNNIAWNLIRNNKDKFLHKGVSAFAGYCRTQANKYGIKGSRVAAAREACNQLDYLMNHVHTPKTRLKDIPHDIAYWVGDCLQIGIEHINIIEEEVRGNGVPEKMLEVCNRKAQFGTTIENAYNIFKRVLDEYGQRALMNQPPRQRDEEI